MGSASMKNIPGILVLALGLFFFASCGFENPSAIAQKKATEAPPQIKKPVLLELFTSEG